MLNKFYEACKKIMKENYKFFLIYFVFFLFCFLPLPFYIDEPGGAINIEEKVKVENATTSKGSFNYAYVSERKATPALYLYALINKDWDIVKEEDLKYDDETLKQANWRNKILMEESNQNAIYVAYRALNLPIEVLKEEVYVTYIDKEADTNLEIGDQILAADGKEIQTRKELLSLIRAKKDGEKVTFTVLADGKEEEKYGVIQTIQGISLIGVSNSSLKQLKTDPEIEILTSRSESGPSGGLMLTLTIYDLLTEEDLTKGYKIVGTGTIDEDGTVGEIGGIDYKIKGAVKEDADLFILPYENLEDAEKLVKERNYDLTLKPVATFEEAVNYLKSLEEKEKEN